MKHGAMNRIYRLVWNDACGCFVAVAEISRGRGKRSSGVAGSTAAALASLTLLLGSPDALADPAVNALPQGGTLVSGQAGWQQAGNKLNITQGSGKATINWQSFDIGSQSQVKISQPNAQSVLLNRVVGADPSALYGRLEANGQVLLVNPNGIVFGKGAQVDVGAIVASTLDIADADFTAGRMKFSRRGGSGSIINQGQITSANGGYVAMLAPQVVNEGVISARLGTVALAAGDAVTLDLQGSELLGVKVDPASIAALVENRELIQAEGGRVLMSAGAAQRLRQAAVAGSAGADSLVQDGNGVMRLVSNSGQAKASSATIEGGNVALAGLTKASTIEVSADSLSQSGVLDASSTATGGRISVSAGQVLQTASARLTADGATAGGSIRLEADGRLYSSATFSATGQAGMGGDIAVTADNLQLRAAALDASGATGGGRIRVGGGFHGAEADLANARQLGVNGSTVLKADATIRGDGGQVVLWSDQTTVYGGHLSARGAAAGGNGGQAEVSGKNDLSYAGSADLAAPMGKAGKLLLDPRNIIIDDAGSSLAGLSLDDPDASPTSGFGSATQALANGNVVITAPNATVGGQAGAGAVYLFNTSTGALLSALQGGAADNHIGSAGIKLLSNGNYLVLSPQYGSTSGLNVFSTQTVESISPPSPSAYALLTNSTASAGAITWQSATGSASLIVSSANSLTGKVANTDSVTQYTYSGNTVVTGGTLSVSASDRVGEVTTYDLYGSVAKVGTTSFTELADGNLAIATTNWYNGRGAVTWMNASTGALVNGAAGGEISAVTSLVGSTPTRSKANLASDAGKQVYVLGLDNSLPLNYQQNGVNRRTTVPGGGGDMVGQVLTALPDGGFVISSPQWSNGAASYAGAVTHVAAGGGAGTVGNTNSLVGSHAYDFVGSGGISVLGGGNYVVSSPYWSDSSNAANGLFLLNNPNGAVTWVAGGSGYVFGTGSTGATVSASNSLTGSDGSLLGARDRGSNSPYTVYDYGNGNNNQQSTRTVVSGTGGVTLLKNGNYLVLSNAWNGSQGAVSFGAAATGSAGAVSAANSLVGTSTGDSTQSSVVELSGSNYLVVAPFSDVGAVDGGAITWGSGTTGVTGAVSSANSLYGSHVSDRVGLGGVLPVGTAGGDGLRANAIVLSPHWGNRSTSASTVAYGAVSWIDGSTGRASGEAGTGALVSAGNSLVGSNAGDYVGSYHQADQRATSSLGNGTNLSQVTGNWDAVLTNTVDVLANGDYVVRSPSWDSGKGAITWAAGNSGVTGDISSANSLVGSVSDAYSTSTSSGTRAGMSFTDTSYWLTTTGDHVGLLGAGLSNGNYVAISPFWSNGSGAITLLRSGNRTGVVSSTNSLVGSTPDSFNDAQHANLTMTGDRLGTLPSLSWNTPTIAETLNGGNTWTTSSTRPLGPYSFSTSNAVNTASNYGGGSNVLLGQSYGTTAVQRLTLSLEYGYLSTSFSFNGTPILKELANGNVLIASPGWNNGAATQAGAVTWFNGSTGAMGNAASAGTLGSSNSLVGSNTGDLLGLRLPVDGLAQLSNGNFVLINPQWNSERGAVTWGSGSAGVTGTVSASNSLVGSTPSASLGLVSASNGVYRIVDTAGTLNSDWVDRSSDLQGDRVGYGGVTALPDGNAVISSPLWTQSTPWTQLAAPSSLGAATWLNGSNGQLRGGSMGGLINASNSLVGSQSGDAVGYQAWVDPYSGVHYAISSVTALAAGAYAVASPWWSNGSASGAGAVTWSAAGGITGTVSSGNSLVGGSAGDHVGRALSSYDIVTYAARIDAGVVALDTGSGINYLVRSIDWANPFSGNGAGAGAVTWVNGGNGRAYGEIQSGATVTANNSIVGENSGDNVGSPFIMLTRKVGNSMVASGDVLLLSNYQYCDDPGAGAITLMSGSHGAAGPVSWRNSMIGLASSSAGQNTTTFDTNSVAYTSDVHATLLPTQVGSAEQVAYRPFVWAAPNADSGKNSTRALVLTTLADNASSPISTDQINGVGGNANWSGSRFAGSAMALSTLGGSGATLGYSASTGNDVVITPAMLTAMLSAGTDVTLQASNDITVLRAINVSAGGLGGDLTLEAGRSINLRADINTDGGNFNARANQSLASGVVNADCAVCTAVLKQQAGTTITTGSGQAYFMLGDGSGKTFSDAGVITLASVSASQITASNDGVDLSGHGQGLRFQPGAVLGNSGTDYITLLARGSSGTGGSIVLQSDTLLIGNSGGTMFVGAANDALAVTFGGSNATGLGMTAAELGAIVYQSQGFDSLAFGTGSQAGLTTVHGLDFTQSFMQRGGNSLDLNLTFQSGSGGITIDGQVKSGSSGDRGIEFTLWDGALTLTSTASLTAGSGRLSFGLQGSSTASQASGAVLSTPLLLVGGSGTATLTAGTNTVGAVRGNLDQLALKSNGSISLGNVDGGLATQSGLTVQVVGATADITLNNTVSNASGDLVLAAGRNFINNNALDTGLLTGTGRYLVYSADPSASTEAMSGYGKHYAQSYNSGSTPSYAGTGNWFLYSIAPTLNISVGSGSTITYGSSSASPAVTLGGFIDGDTAASATSGTLNSTLSSYTPSGAGFIPAGSYTLTLNGQGSFTTSLGYTINLTPGSSTLTVQPKTLNLGGLAASAKVYDGTTTVAMTGTASLSGSGSSDGDGRYLNGDTVQLSGTASGNFADRHAGTGKTVTIGGLTLSGADAGNYSINPGSVTADITPKTLFVDGLSAAASKVYDGNNGASVSGTAALLTRLAPGAGNSTDGRAYTGDTISISGTATGSYNATTVLGAHTVSFGGLTLSGSDAGDYQLSLGTQAASITPKTLTLSGISASNKVYDATTTATLSGTASLGGVVGSDAVGLSGTASASFASAEVGHLISVGVSGLSLSGAAASNYTLAGFSTQADITPRSLNITAQDLSKVYGDLDPLLAFSVGGLGLVGNDTLATVFSGNLSAVTGANATAGTHAITQGTLVVNNGNYQIGGYTAGTLTVTKATLRLTAADAAKVYGAVDPTLGFTVNTADLKYADTAAVVSGVQLSTVTGAAATAGTHAITASGGSADNYDIVATGGTLAVSKATLRLTAADAAKVYGAADPTLGFTVNTADLKYTDTAAVVSGVQLSTATGANATAGTHAITASGATADNYDVVASNGTLTVAKATLLASASDATKVYGAADPTLGFTVDASQLKYNDSAAVVRGLQLSTVTGAAATAGTHTITASGGTADNYEVTTRDGTLTVAKATLTVTADDKSKTAGEPDPALSYSVSTNQLRYNDTAAVVSAVQLSAPRGAGVAPGSYAITASGGRADNYALQYVDGTLTVTPSPSINAENLISQIVPPATQASLITLAVPPTVGAPAPTPGQPGSVVVMNGGISGVAPNPISGEPVVESLSSAPVGPGTMPSIGAAGSQTRLIAIQPVRQLTLDTQTAFRIDASTSFEKPPQAKVDYTARLADGRPVPSWLSLDAATGVLSGTPPAGENATLEVVVTAQIEGGASATTRISLRVRR